MRLRETAGGASPSPTSSLDMGRGAPWGSRRPWICFHWLGKPRRRSRTAPVFIFANPGPSGPAGIETLTQILRAGTSALTNQERVPRNGGPGVRRIWTRSVHPEPSPGDPLVSFPSLGKKLAARRRRNSPHIGYKCYKIQGGDHPRASLKFSSTARAAW